MADEEPGLLGNLPRSRPGTRSDKRSDAETGDQGSRPASKRSQAAKPGVKRAASARKGTGSKRAGASQRTTSVTSESPAKGAPASKGGPKAKPVPVTVAEPETPREEPKHEKTGPLSSAAKVAGTGLRVAEGVTREVLKRLPRP
jgi:hypothetical protein